MVATGAAHPPSGFAQVQPGLWEISGIPGAASPLRQCVADVAVLARFEHRSSNCSSKVLRETGSATEIEYSCGAAGFGSSQVSVITPRALRIATQGISDGLPFNYVLQAHHIGGCPAGPRH